MWTGCKTGPGIHDRSKNQTAKMNGTNERTMKATHNPLNRYLINSPMLPDFKRDADGGLTLYVQRESPGKDKESNWLPAPSSPFMAVLRLYWPKDEATNGQWKQPPLKRAE